MEALKNKILLIEPPFFRLSKDTFSIDRFPLSLGYLAGTIKRHTNWSVMAYNADFSPKNEFQRTSYMTGEGFDNYLKNLKIVSGKVWREVASTIAEYNPSVVGISANSQNFMSACKVARFVKEFNRDIPVVVGGPHASMVGPAILDFPDIDIVVKGEGENTIVELLNAINTGSELGTVKGIIYRKNDQIIATPPREFIEDLDSLCFPHESAPEVLKDYKQYTKDKFSYIFATRGCPYNCFFCGSRNIWSQRVRFRSALNVVSEIKALQSQGLHLVNFSDDTFGITSKYINELCEALIMHCPGLRWSCEMHANLVNEQIISLMKRAGCCKMHIGIESGNNYILDKIRKGFTIEKAFKALQIIKKSNIVASTFFMVGFPQETEDMINDTIRAIKTIPCDEVMFSIFTPYPGTEAFEFCKAKGLIPDDFDISLYNHQSPVNYFCPNISRERFKAKVAEIEKIVDEKSLKWRIKEIFSIRKISRIRELGLTESIKRGFRIFLKK